MPFILLSVSCQFPFTSFHVPSISVNHIFVLRSPYLISLLSFCSFMSFWCSSGFPFRSSHFPSHFPSHVPSHFPFMSLSFYSLVTSVSFPFSFKSFHFSCMSCHFFKIISDFRAYSFQIMFMVLGSFHDLPCSFMHRGANSLCDNVQQF